MKRAIFGATIKQATSENVVVEEESDFAERQQRFNSTGKRVLPLLVDDDDDRRLTMPRISDSEPSETPSDREYGLLNGQDIHPMFDIESARI
jgi:hypothetical protein